jgi:hypothetical protein
VQNSIRGLTDGWPLGVSGTKPNSVNPFLFSFSSKTQLESLLLLMLLIVNQVNAN